MSNLYHLQEIPPFGYRWSGAKTGFEVPPAIGTRVFVNMNGFGNGTVRAYFVEEGWLGVEVEVDQRPEWHLKKGDANAWPMVFGTEIAPERKNRRKP